MLPYWLAFRAMWRIPARVKPWAKGIQRIRKSGAEHAVENPTYCTINEEGSIGTRKYTKSSDEYRTRVEQSGIFVTD